MLHSGSIRRTCCKCGKRTYSTVCPRCRHRICHRCRGFHPEPEPKETPPCDPKKS